MLTNKQIKIWLDQQDIKNYTIRPDGVVDVDGEVHIHSTVCKSPELPIQFGVITGEFFVVDPVLQSMKGAPYQVDGRFTWQYSHGGGKISSLEYMPKIYGSDIFIHGTAIRSLSGIDKIIKRINGRFYCGSRDNEGKFIISTHALGLILLPGMIRINLDGGPIDKIMNKYVGTGDILSAQDELIDAGFIDQARL